MIQSATDAKLALRTWMPRREWRTILDGLNGEERSHFAAKLTEFADRIATMPESYQQDGLGDQAIAYLHYFTSSGDWYITEKDRGSTDDEIPGQQIEAFGIASLGYGYELGYISIVDLVGAGAELDLYFTPQTLAIIRGQ